MKGLFDQVVNALNNPSQQASTNQLGGIMNTVQQLSGNQGMNSAATQVMLSVVGNYVRSALQEKRATGGEAQAQAIVNQFGGTAPNPQAVQSLFSPSQQQQVVNDAAQRTGLNAGTIQAMLPIIIPVILNLLQSGNNTQNPGGSNSVLHSFLDTNGDGSFDVGDAIGMVGRFLQQPR